MNTSTGLFLFVLGGLFVILLEVLALGAVLEPIRETFSWILGLS